MAPNKRGRLSRSRRAGGEGLGKRQRGHSLRTSESFDDRDPGNDLESAAENSLKRKGYFMTASNGGFLRLAGTLIVLFLFTPARAQQDSPVRVIAFGAHPDDCDLSAGGLAAKYATLGYKVKFVSLTNGDAGHQSQSGQTLAARRRAEAKEAGRRIGIEYDVLDSHDGELLPTLAVRQQVIRKIREWQADVVLAPRPNDYHPDHRDTGILVQDASYMVTVPDIVPDTPALRKNPVFPVFLRSLHASPTVPAGHRSLD